MDSLHVGEGYSKDCSCIACVSRWAKIPMPCRWGEGPVNETFEDNCYYMQEQEPREFSSLTDCPHCGALDVHPFATAIRPRWARVARKCVKCNRMWAEK